MCCILTEMIIVFHPTVARGAVGFKSNRWQLGSTGLVQFPFSRSSECDGVTDFDISNFTETQKQGYPTGFGGTQCLVSSNTRQRENSPPLAGHLEECSHSSNTPFTRLSQHESKATVTHFVSRWAAGSTSSSASSPIELRNQTFRW